MARQLLSNLVLNGNFETSPTFTAAQTASNWVDGTAAGSATPNFYKWFVSKVNSPTGSVQFDSATKLTGKNSLKIAVTGVTGASDYFHIGNCQNIANPVAADSKVYGFRVKPSTQYTVKVTFKTDSITTANSKGVRGEIRRHKSDMSFYGSNNTNFMVTGFSNSTFVTGTNDWTTVTQTFTTDANDYFWIVSFYFQGETGTVWIDDINIAPTAGITRTAIPIPRTQVNNLFSSKIDLAIGDTPRTTAGWLEDNENLGFYINRGTTAVSAEADTAVTRTGAKTLKLSTTDATGTVFADTANDRAATYVGTLRFLKTLKPNTSYTFSCYVKTTNAAASSVVARVLEYSTALARSVRAPTALTGTVDWTLQTVTWTSGATAQYAVIDLAIEVAGNISDAWFDVNSMELIESGLQRNIVFDFDSGTALNFNGTTDLCTITSFPITAGGIYTFHCKFKNNTMLGEQAIISGGGGSFVFGTWDSRFFNWVDSDAPQHTIVALFRKGIWYDLTWTTNLTTGVTDLYVDGTMIGSGTAPVWGLSSSNVVKIGAYGALRFWKGLLDDVTIWDRALTATEIQNLYYNNIYPTTNLIAKYLFNEGSGSTIIDSSGNGYNGTITGATYTTDAPCKPRTQVT
jgi:hypothetical protein